MTLPYLDLLGDPLSERPARPGRLTPRGYAADPGSGPDGRTCADCAHCKRVPGGGRRQYSKCDLCPGTWTHAAGSDIARGSPACRHFSPCTPEAPR
jgi:hypothetical protein